MDLHANCFAAALLVLLLAASATDAVPSSERTIAVPIKRATPLRPRADVEAPQPEETAVPLNAEEEEGQTPSALSLCRLMPRLTPSERRSCEEALSVPNLKERWEALTAQVIEQIRESAVDEEGLKVPAFLEKMNDPEIRKDLLQVALGAAGMTATGLMLGNGAALCQLALMSLYATAFFQLLKSGAQLTARLRSALEQTSVPRTDQGARQKLAKLIGVRPEDEATPRRMDDQ